MSLEAALAEESSSVLKRLDPRQTNVSRGRNANDRSLSPHSQLRSTSRGRDRGRSSSRRATSRARSQGEDVNYKWSILFHDPSERFVNLEKSKSGGKNDINSDDEDVDEDDISEEEQLSDDEDDFDYDLNDLKMPNYRLSINEYFKGRSATSNNNSNAAAKGPSTATKLVNSVAKNLHLTTNEDQHIKKEGEKLEQLSEVLALEKGLQDAKSLGNKVPKETIAEVSKRLNDIGFEGERLSVNDLVELENAKDSKYEEYKKTLIDESKLSEVDGQEDDEAVPAKEERIKESEIDVNEENLRVSKTMTLGRFFTKGLRNGSIASYLLYMDLSPESVNSLQYTLGAVVKSGDVLYIINSVNDEDDIEFYKRQSQRLTDLIRIYLNLIQDPKFKLHVVIESLNQTYPKHFLNELIKYLKPRLLIVCYKLITSELNNYISNVPMMIVKRRAKRRRSAV